MDRFSHIELAKGLLRISNEDVNLAYMSILPLVDGEPSFLHRLHCHPISKSPTIVEAAKLVFGYEGEDLPDLSDDSFELRRFKQEKQEFVDAFDKLVSPYTSRGMEIRDGYAPLLSVISHTYFDTFNNAVQAFTPYESYCAGQYDMWHKVDYFNYRIKWYQQTAPKVRENVLNEAFWSEYSFTAEQLVKGMVERLASFTKPSISDETLKKVQRDLNVDNVPSSGRVQEFYIKLENSLKKHLMKSVNDGKEVVVSI